MKYPTIRIEGAILASDILDRIEQGEITGQRPADFKMEGNFKVKDEIARAWADARDYWRIFQRKREALAQDERQTGTSETRSQWMIPFLSMLGYKTEFARAEEVNGKSYAISHRDQSLDGFPIHIMGFKDSLDKKRQDSGPRMSPHALVQEYLNLTEHLFAIATNGLQLRLLRDSSRLIKLSFIEFDLERMMDEEQYADFAILFRLLHYTRMPINQESVGQSLMEEYHQDSLESGSRIRSGLSEAVEKSILAFSNGFLQHPANDELRNWFEEGDHKDKETQFYEWQLRLIYRLLFLMVIEERDLIYPKGADKKLKAYYYNFYSINKLRKLSEKRHLADARYTDYWQSIRNTFRLFENEKYGSVLGIKPLSGLFESHQTGLLNTATLNNKVMMECLRKLSVFKNKNNNQVMRVNYASLNVEEFGSVYEGLLEYDAVVQPKMGRLFFDFIKGSERSSSGSHYTPDELVQPLIKHSLDYIIADKLKEPNPEQALLTIRVCDVSCGSGHILLNAARRIATELALVRTGEDQPSPASMRQATRDVIRNCIYGVDLNPLAVELCKVALWLEAHNPNEPLNFLDHHIKCGNAIVGLAHRDELEKGIATEAFKALSAEEKDYKVPVISKRKTGITFASYLAKKNKSEKISFDAKALPLKAEYEEVTKNTVNEALIDYDVFKKMPERSPEEITAKQKAYSKFLDGKGYTFLKTMCDTQVAQFFIPKTEANKDRLMTDNDFRQIMQGYMGWQGPKTAKAMAISQEKRFFHWFLEFPEVFIKGGFDCILGNPPFLGGLKLSTNYGNPFLNYIHSNYYPAKGTADLVVYFFRRIFDIIIVNGYHSLISTNTIAQGGSRIGGLAYIIKNGGTINHGIRSMRWPGLAAVEVALVTVFKGVWKGRCILDNRPVDQITSYLDDSVSHEVPFKLKANENYSSIGSFVLGSGFLLTPEEANLLILKDNKNKHVLLPYLNGEDLNSQVNQNPTRWAINFQNWPLRRYTPEEWIMISNENKIIIKKLIKSDRFIEIAPPDYKKEVAEDYPDCLSIIERLVKPERDKLIGGNATAEDRAKRWWQFARPTIKLYESIKDFEKVIVVAQTTKQPAFNFSENNRIFSLMTVVFCFSDYKNLCILQSTIHDIWAWKNGSTNSISLRYTPSDIFETFAFPKRSESLNEIGKLYYSLRNELIFKIQLGLTKTYNTFHSPIIKSGIKSQDLEGKTSKEIVEKHNKEVWYLWNHLQNTSGTCIWEEALVQIEELRHLHKEMDEAVLEAYGWHEDNEKWGKAIKLRHDFYEVDYLPENDRVRYTIHPDARKEVLKRLLLLNHERYAEEIAAGLHKKKDVLDYYQQKGVEVPKDTKFSDGSAAKNQKKKKTYKVNEPASPYGQMNLFEQATQAPQTGTICIGSKVTIQKEDKSIHHYHITKTAIKGQFTGECKQILHTSPLAEVMMGRKTGDRFVFGGVGYEVESIEY